MTTKKAKADSGKTRWVNLGRACEILGVNESTVRRWADAGQIRCFRTPGGHRRFAESDLVTLTEGGGSTPHELETATVRRIRRTLHSGSAAGDWYSDIHEDEREALRPLGRRLVELVETFISTSGDDERERIEAEVDNIGTTYGQMLFQRDKPLLQAVQAFTFFRKSLDDTAKQLAERSQLTPDEAAKAREAIAGLADRVLLGVTGAYDSATASTR